MMGVCLACCLLMACHDEEPIGGKKEKVEDWITNYIYKEYLWSEEAKQKTPDTSSPEKLFYSLLSVEDGKTRQDGSHYYYSTIEKKQETKAIRQESSYGFDFVLYQVLGDMHQGAFYYGRILYVLPGTPAQRAGLKRGDWIFELNGSRITPDNYKGLASGGAMTMKVSRSTALKGKIVQVEAAVPVEENPLYLDSVLEVNHAKVGYLVYNQFKAGKEPNQKDGTYDKQMLDIFKKFKEEGVSEFVLDLRYNGGGYLSSAQLLAGLLVPDKDKNSIFCFLENNKGDKEGYKFAPTLGNNLNLERVFVLTSSQTASASEAVINGLKPYMEVIQIGGKTEGKNVGSVLEEHAGWAMQPIVFRIYNAGLQSDYADGIQPEVGFRCDELDLDQNNEMLPLGDRNEFMLAKALKVINGAELQEELLRATSGSDGFLRLHYNSLERKKEEAVRIR